MKLVIYQTSDLHGFVYPTNYVKPMDLGLLKIGSYIIEDEKQYDHSLKIDCGDLIQGSPMTHYIHKKGLDKNVMIDGMEAIGYDVYVLGNHEFNYGLDYLYHAYQPIQNKLLNANIKGLHLKTKPYQIFDFNGFKVACIGLTTSYIPNWEQTQNITGLTFLDPVEMYYKYEKEMQAQADFIIVCYHGGFEKSVDERNVPTEKLTKENQASELLEKFDSINLMLTGHQHRSFITKVKEVVCSQPMHNGQTFTKIVIDTSTKDIQYELLSTADIETEINPNLENLFHDTNVKLEQYLDQIVGTFQSDLLIKDIFQARLQGHPLVSLIHQVQLDISNADVSVTSLFDTAIGFEKEVSIRDILINYPYPNTLRVLKLKGHKIKEAIEKSATYFVLENNQIVINEEFLVPKVQNYNYDMYGGISYKVDISQPFYQRVTSIKINGKELDLDYEYTVVLNNYRASNISVYPCYENAEVVKEIDIDMSELLLNYFQKYKKIELNNYCNYQFIW